MCRDARCGVLKWTYVPVRDIRTQAGRSQKAMSHTFGRVVVDVDGSLDSLQALRFAVGHAPQAV
jgi:hypothetical protein